MLMHGLCQGPDISKFLFLINLKSKRRSEMPRYGARMFGDALFLVNFGACGSAFKHRYTSRPRAFGTTA